MKKMLWQENKVHFMRKCMASGDEARINCAQQSPSSNLHQVSMFLCNTIQIHVYDVQNAEVIFLPKCLYFKGILPHQI